MNFSRRLNRRALALAGVGAASVLLASATAGGVHAAASAHPTAVRGAKTITLPTGDRISVRTDASGAVRSAYPAGPAHGSFLIEHYGSDMYVIPTKALRELAKRHYTLAQFDVSALAAGRAGREPGAGTVHPHFPMHTATIKVLDPKGKPADYAQLSVVNTDDSRKYGEFPEAMNGEARLSMPDGHYALMAYTAKSSRNSITWERLTFGSFTVDGGAVTTTVKTSAAKNPVSVHTPKASTPIGLDLEWYRGSSDQMGISSGLSTPTDHPVYLSTSPKGTGSQHFAVHEARLSPSGASSPYLYDVEFLNDDTIGANQKYTASVSSLATVDSRYYSDKPGRDGESVWFGLPAWDSSSFRMGVPMTAPLHRAEYVTADPALSYFEIVEEGPGGDAWSGWMDSGYRQFRPGEKLRADWFRGPLAPGVPADTGTGPYDCGACRYDDTLSISLSPVTDSTPDHSWSPDDPSQQGTVSTSRFRLYRGSTLLAEKKNVVGGAYQVPAASSKYRIRYDQTRKAPWTSQSTISHTDWRFTSQHSGITTVPDRWACDLKNGRTKDCSAVGLLLPNYQLSEGLNGKVAPGPDSLQLNLTHTSGSAQSPIQSATVSISYDGGKTWTRTKLCAFGAGRYKATWTNPASSKGRKAAIRITAKDAAGGSVTQTVNDAFTITAS